MLGLEVLDVVIGLIFMYLILSIPCTAFAEMFAGITGLRGKTLFEGIKNLFEAFGGEGKPTADGFYEHPMVAALFRKNGRKPSYIPPRVFARAFVDMLDPGKAKGVQTIIDIQRTVDKLPNSDLKRFMNVFLSEAGDDMKLMYQNIENWFDDAMNRISGWYKRKAQLILFLCALVVAFIANADTFEVARTLNNDPEIRKAVVLRAVEIANRTSITQGDAEGEKTPPAMKGDEVEQFTSKINNALVSMDEASEQALASGLPLGWKQSPLSVEWRSLNGFTKIFGLLFTALALSLGAQFWFDVLKKVINLRSVGSQPDGFSDKKGQKDGQEQKDK